MYRNIKYMWKEYCICVADCTVRCHTGLMNPDCMTQVYMCWHCRRSISHSFLSLFSSHRRSVLLANCFILLFHISELARFLFAFLFRVVSCSVCKHVQQAKHVAVRCTLHERQLLILYKFICCQVQLFLPLLMYRDCSH